MIYLDYAASAPLMEAAKKEMMDCLSLYANPSSSHSAGLAAKAKLEEYRSTVAECLGCEPDEVLFTSGGTESNNLAIQGTAPFWKEKKAVLTAIEHPSVRNALLDMRAHGYGIEQIPVSGNGVISLSESIRELSDASFISVMLANNELGTIQPVSSIADAIGSSNALIHTDAVQAVGHIPIDFSKLQVNLLSLSSHKFGGPKGAGALLCKRGTPISPLLKGGGQENGLRSGTESLLLAAGTATALKNSVQTMQQDAEKIISLRSRLERALYSLHAIVLGNEAERLPGHCAACFPGISSSALQNQLDLFGISVSAGSACHSSSQAPSPVLTAIHLDPSLTNSVIRISIGPQTSEAEIDELIFRLTDLIQKKNETI